MFNSVTGNFFDKFPQVTEDYNDPTFNCTKLADNKGQTKVPWEFETPALI